MKRRSQVLAITAIVIGLIPLQTATASPAIPGCWTALQGSRNWWSIGSPFDLSNHGKALFAFDPAFPSTIYATTTLSHGLPGQGLDPTRWPDQVTRYLDELDDPVPFARSEDSGCTWTNLDLDTALASDYPRGISSIQRITVVHSGSTERAFVQLDDGKVARTDDEGKTWAVVLRPDPEVSFTTDELLTAPSDPNVIYAVSRSNHIAATVSTLYASDDGGNTWVERTQEGLNPTSLSLMDFAQGEIVADQIGASNKRGPWNYYVDPLDAEELWATNNRIGLLHSSDGGETWQAMGPEFVNAGTVSLDVAHIEGEKARLAMVVDEAQYQGTDQAAALYWSDDGGFNWTTGALPDVVYAEYNKLYPLNGPRGEASDRAGAELVHGTTSRSFAVNFQITHSGPDGGVLTETYRLDLRSGRWNQLSSVTNPKPYVIPSAWGLIADSRPRPFMYMISKGQLVAYTGRI